jgi:hypothetical protein
MQQGTVIMSEVYWKTLKETAYGHSENRHGMLTSSVVPLHDNMCLHTAACTQALLEHFNWELFAYPKY